MLWLWIVATLAAFFVKGLCGFANTLVFTSITGFGINNVNISPVELLLGLPSNVILAWKHRKQLQHKVWIPLAIIILLGGIPGALILKYVNAQYIKIVFGIVIILIGIEMFFRDSRKKTGKKNMAAGVLVALVSGILCGMFGIGVMMAAYLSRIANNNNQFKANLAAIFIVENLFRICSYTALGVITWASIRQTLILYPFMLLAMWLGMQSSKVLNEKAMKKLVIVLIIISGIVLVVKNI